jgi:hypothetical protein
MYICNKIIKNKYDWGIVRTIIYGDKYELNIYQEDIDDIIDDIIEGPKIETFIYNEDGETILVMKTKHENINGLVFTFKEIEVFVPNELLFDNV